MGIIGLTVWLPSWKKHCFPSLGGLIPFALFQQHYYIIKLSIIPQMGPANLIAQTVMTNIYRITHISAQCLNQPGCQNLTTLIQS